MIPLTILNLRSNECLYLQQAVGSTFVVWPEWVLVNTDSPCQSASAVISIITEPNWTHPGKSGEEHLWADETRLREPAGWTAKFAGLDGFGRGIATTAGRFADKDNLIRYKAGTYVI